MSRFNALLLSAAVLSLPLACNLISLEELDITTYPSRKDQIIAASNMVWVEFSDPVERENAERLFTIENPGGAVDGDYVWSGRRLSFQPNRQWIPGVRYVMQFSGAVDTDDGRRFDPHIVVPFYGGSRTGPPRLLSSAPADEAVCGIRDQLAFTFSASIDTDRFRDHFSLSPSAEYDIAWSADDTACTVAPKEQWGGLARYTWTIPKEIPDREGRALAESCTGSFRVLADTGAPALLSLLCANRAAGYAADALALLDNDRGLWFEFSEPMDWSGWEKAFTIEPCIDMVAIFQSPTVVVMDPQERWIPGETYTVSVGSDLRDEGGNPIVEIARSVTVSVPQQRLERIDNTPAVSTPATFLPPDWAQGVPLAIEALVGTGRHTFTLTFAEEYEAADIERLLDAITIEAYHPGTIASPTLLSVSFDAINSPDRLTLLYEGFTPSPAGSVVYHLYRLFIPADETATANGNGSCLLDPVEIYFEAVP